jgi:hypothetical protein
MDQSMGKLVIRPGTSSCPTESMGIARKPLRYTVSELNACMP